MTVLLLAVLLAVAPQEKKDPVPDAAALKSAEALLRSVFKEDFAKKGPSDRLALARKLSKQGSETMDDAASRYVLLREAKDLFLGAGDFESALRAADEVARSFEGNVVAWKSAILSAASKSAKTPEESVKAAKSWMALADEATGAGELAEAEKASQEAVSIAKKGKDISLIAKAEAKGRGVAEQRARAEELKKARQTLKEKADDPAANLLVGRHECFVAGNWEAGLPLLARGSDAALKQTAAGDLALPADAAAQVAIGDGWWDVAEKEPEDRQARIRARARFWYQRAAPRLTGLQKTKVLQRLGDAAAAQFGGDWVDLTNPALFGVPKQGGDAIVLVPPGLNQSKRADLIKEPEGAFDGVTARIQYPPNTKQAMGYVCLEAYHLAAYLEPSTNSFIILRADMEKKLWVQERVLPVRPRSTFVITILVDGPDYVFHLDGKEMTRWKAGTGKILPLSLQAQSETVTFDQIKLRIKP